MQHHQRALIALPLAAALLLTACSPDETPTQAAPTASLDGSASGAVESNEADEMFAAMMIEHHQQAIEMSDVVLGLDGVDPEVTALAERIKEAQGPEIELMQDWLADWGSSPDPAEHGGGDHGAMDGGMMSDDDLTALAAASGPEASRLFLEQMIVHHEGALAMAKDHLDAGQHPETLVLANEIIAAQTSEIAEMTAMLGGSDSALLEQHGLDGLTAVEIIDQLDAVSLAERSSTLRASVRPDHLLVTGVAGEEVTLPVPDGEFYLSVAPYVSATHECHFHSLTTCVGELRNTAIEIVVTDDETGEALIEETRTTFDNGFVGLWLPRGGEFTLTISADGRTATVPITTSGDDTATCLTTLQLI